MKKSFPKIISFVMSFILLLAMITFAVIAEDDGGKLSFDQRFSDASDVPLWAQNGCEATYDAGIIGGFEDGMYRAVEKATRAQLWTYLYNSAKYLGKDVSVPEDYRVIFPDAVAGAWYEGALRWAAYNNIVCVSDAGTVAPDRAVMRWELAVEGYRFIEYSGLKYKETAAHYNYTDTYMLPEWAAEPILGALKTGVISSVLTSQFMPEQTCTRAQLAVYIYRIFDNSYSAGSTLIPSENEAASLPVPDRAFSVRMNTADKLFYGDCNDRVLGQVIFEDEECSVDLQIMVKNSLWESGVILCKKEGLDKDNSIFQYSIDFGGAVQDADGREIELVSESSDWYVAVLVRDGKGNTLTIDYKVTCLSISEGRDRFAYSVEGNDASIYAYIGDDTDLFIPEMIDGYFVGKLLDGAFADRGVKTLHIPETVYWIGDIKGEKDLSMKIIFNGSECEYNTIDKHSDFADVKYTCTEEGPAHRYTDESEVILEPSAIMEGIKGRYCIYCYDVQDVEYIPMKEVELNFTDVSEGSWYRKAVEFAVDEGLFNGMSATTFCPEVPMTRAMLVTVLYRMEGSPDMHSSNPFTDVKSGAWYEKAVAWANANRIVFGVSGNRFAPDENITREALSTILYRYSAYAALNRDVRADLTLFEDGAAVSDWAQEAMSWANGVGIIAGNNIGGNLLLDPQGKATRAQVATMLGRFSLYRDYGIIL